MMEDTVGEVFGGVVTDSSVVAGSAGPGRAGLVWMASTQGPSPRHLVSHTLEEIFIATIFILRLK